MAGGRVSDVKFPQEHYGRIKVHVDTGKINVCYDHVMRSTIEAGALDLLSYESGLHLIVVSVTS